MTHLSFYGNTSYTLGNSRFTLSYDEKRKFLDDAGMMRNWHDDKWNASFTYGNGNWFLMLKVENIFNEKERGWDKYNALRYTSFTDSRKWGRCFVINLTYTFGYGKKVSKYIDINRSGVTKTSVIGGE